MERTYDKMQFVAIYPFPKKSSIMDEQSLDYKSHGILFCGAGLLVNILIISLLTSDERQKSPTASDCSKVIAAIKLRQTSQLKSALFLSICHDFVGSIAPGKSTCIIKRGDYWARILPSDRG